MESRLSGRKLKPLPPDPFRHQNSAIAPNTRTCAMNTNPLLSQFRISAAMRPYVLRVRPRGTDFEFGSEPEQAVAYTKCIMEMRRILVKKRGVPCGQRACQSVGRAKNSVASAGFCEAAGLRHPR
jgi:hypothetical protein